MIDFGIRQALNIPYEDALQRVPEALKTEGFGVLTQIDIHSTLKAKIGVDFRRYTILGACNPPLAHQALTTELEIGMFLPCNVVVYETDDGNSMVVAIDPVRTIASVGLSGLDDIASTVQGKLQRALATLVG